MIENYKVLESRLLLPIIKKDEMISIYKELLISKEDLLKINLSALCVDELEEMEVIKISILEGLILMKIGIRNYMGLSTIDENKNLTKFYGEMEEEKQ